MNKKKLALLTVAVFLSATVVYFRDSWLPYITNEVVNFLTIFVGVLWRTLRPWLKKFKAYTKACEDAEDQGKPAPSPSDFGLGKHGIQFKKSFVISGTVSLMSIVVISAMVGALQQNPAMSGLPLFMWAVGQTEVINREIL